MAGRQNLQSPNPFIHQKSILPRNSLLASPTKDSGPAPAVGCSCRMVSGFPPLIETYASKAGNSSTKPTNSTNLLTRSTVSVPTRSISGEKVTRGLFRAALKSRTTLDESPLRSLKSMFSFVWVSVPSTSPSSQSTSVVSPQ